MLANKEYKDDRTYSVNLNPHRMIIEKKLRIILYMACLSAMMYGCTKKWDVRTDVTDPNLQGNLFERLSQNTDLSEFNKLLVKVDTIKCWPLPKLLRFGRLATRHWLTLTRK
jgi:hypothetical protein